MIGRSPGVAVGSVACGSCRMLCVLMVSNNDSDFQDKKDHPCVQVS